MRRKLSAEKMLFRVIEEIQKLKVRSLRIVDASGYSLLADMFVIGTVDSVVQLEAVRNRLIEEMEKHGWMLKNPLESWEGGWLLLDFGDMIFHLMLEELRSFYGIDTLIEGREVTERFLSSHHL
ncbi:MAG: ribosome silencing factor [Brevinematales bacterium]|nr:ribosome silencing factor [Brevinematales bacterium]